MKHTPNILSAFRIVLIPFFAWQMMSGNTLNAAVILGVSGLTDMLDGLLARRFGWISQLGKVLDPVADKLTQVTVCIVLAVRLRKYWPFFLILLVKEVVLLTLGGYLMKKGVRLDGARWFGKVATVLFYVTMVSIMLFPSMPVTLINILLTLTVFCALAAAVLYLPEFRRYRREQVKGR